MAAVAGWTHPEYAAARADALEGVIYLRHPEALRLTAGALVIREAELEEADLAVVRKLAESAYNVDLEATIGDLVGRLREGSATERARRLLITLAPGSVEALID